ncbi:MAG: PVC-type heme-binding CxxCH protein [Puniceicoccaceae bacterium]
MKLYLHIFALLILLTSPVFAKHPADKGDHLHFAGGNGPGAGKHIVLLAGDEEYRSEEALPMLAQLLSKHHGFKCTVLFSLDEKGIVSPTTQNSLSNADALDSADLIIMSLRFRNWEDDAMQKFENALLRGTPIVALRTSTHAFKFPNDSKWIKYSFRAKPETGWENGFGRQVLGETWVAHHGKHKVEGCRSVVEEANKNHPLLNGVGVIFAESDVYTANPPADVTVLQRGMVTETLEPDSGPVAEKNNPMQPITWIRKFKNDNGKTNKIFTTTMGAASDLDDANLRRLVVNACYWGLNLKVPKKAKVDIPDSYQPTFFGFNTFKQNTKPADHIPVDATAKAALPSGPAPDSLDIVENGRIAILGAGLASRMMKFGHFETELHLRYSDAKLTIRNFADEGSTPGFRPHSGRKEQFAFPGAEKYFPNYLSSKTNGFFQTPDEWLYEFQPDTILAFFGFNSAMREDRDVEQFKNELRDFIHHTLTQWYNGKNPPQLALVSSTAIQDLSATHHTPDGKEQNELLDTYTKAMQEVANETGVLFVDAFSPSSMLFRLADKPLTVDGALLTDEAYQWLAPFLANSLYSQKTADQTHHKLVHEAVMEKNYTWHNLYKIPNGVHVYGRRHKPYGPDNYPHEWRKLGEMTEVRDEAIWHALNGKLMDLAAADKNTYQLPPVLPDGRAKDGDLTQTEYKTGSETAKSFTLPKGYEATLFADESMFPELANPAQMSFDNRGRLWVGCMPSYPHWKPGDPKPEDKLLILEDTDNDGKADKCTAFADDLHLVTGFELAEEGVYVAQADSLLLLKDTDGDDHYDEKIILASGFDDHDTHHKISAFCADPSGAIFMGEGLFLYSNVETVYGTNWTSDGGFYRYNPKRHHLERTSQLRIPNPWGTVFDRWGQIFFLHTSNPSMAWMSPATVKPVYGNNLQVPTILTSEQVRPTSGIEIVSSRHFPDEVQGDILLCNVIGFRGIKQHKVEESSAGFTTTYRQDLLESSYENFRPVDLEFAPDGSLYFVDWTNMLIGHMQHNARDPRRDKDHGRIFRITYPSRPLVEPAKVDGASIEELLDNLTLHEDRTRYRTRRELRGRNTEDVLAAVKTWTKSLNKRDPDYERYLLEGLWVTWGHDRIDENLVEKLLSSDDHRIRAAATRAVRYNIHQLSNHAKLLAKAAEDDHGRVRLEAMTAASWLPKEIGLPILQTIDKAGSDEWTSMYLGAAGLALGDASFEERQRRIAREAEAKAKAAMEQTGVDPAVFQLGKEVYNRPAHCATCHQPDGNGLPAANFPPLAGTRWVNEDDERLIKISLKGMLGPITVGGKEYNGAMTPFEALLTDEEIAAVLTYVKNAFGNSSGTVEPEMVAKVRAEMKDKPGLLNAAELLKEHPHK